MTRRSLLAAAGGALGALAARRGSGQATTRPNVLVIHCDELSFRALGCYRAQLPAEQSLVWGTQAALYTPNIDRLARAGVLCDRFYAASPVCTPSRAAFVSGRYPQNTGAVANDLPLADDVETFAAVLARAGYATGYAGKWHLDGAARPGWTPARRFGFADNRFMFNRGHWKQLEDTTQGPRVRAVNAGGQPTYAVAGADATSFTTDFLTDRTIEFAERHAAGPFAWMLSIPDPHDPNTVRPPYDAMFADVHFDEPASAKQVPADLPGWAQPAAGRFAQAPMQRYFGMVRCIDDNVGRILAALDRLKLTERTIIVFTADHGDLCGEHGRHNKGVPLEASARIPFIIVAPGLLKAGQVDRTPLTTADFKPTLLGLLGLRSAGHDEGRNAAPLLRGDRAPDGWRNEAMVRIGTAESGNAWFGVFTAHHKLILSPYDPPCLFDLSDDPFELRNRFAEPGQRELVRSLSRSLRDHAQRYHEPLLAITAVKADLDWCVEATTPYRSTHTPRRPARLVEPEE
ncbi:MAG: sulfatase [Armatimonadetes bacterium]|nr:sulfatase [Armatimonadota bacterium]